VALPTRQTTAEGGLTPAWACDPASGCSRPAVLAAISALRTRRGPRPRLSGPVSAATANATRAGSVLPSGAATSTRPRRSEHPFNAVSALGLGWGRWRVSACPGRRPLFAAAQLKQWAERTAGPPDIAAGPTDGWITRSPARARLDSRGGPGGALTGLEPVPRYSGDDCPSSALYGSVRSSQGRSGGDAVQCVSSGDVGPAGWTARMTT
jgi:hypothetical protein